MATHIDAKGRRPVGLEVRRDLLCAEEWKDPKGAKVLGEYHKDGLPDQMLQIDQDLESFEKYWKKKGAINIRGEYHKTGAPHVEEPTVWEGHARSSEDDSEMPFQESAPVVVEKAVKVLPEPLPKVKKEVPSLPGPSEERETINRPLGMAAAEMMVYGLFRMLFGHGITIPIKREGMVDMDIKIKGKDVIINTNCLFYSVPELSVWRIIYSHQGKPILEMGRGVKNGMRVHRFNALIFVVQMWKGGIEQRKQKAKLDAVIGGNAL